MKVARTVSVLTLTLAAAGCVTYPTGPSIMALPGTRMSFDQFRGDDMECRAYAARSVGADNPQQVAQQSGATSAAIGTVVGALAGAAIGGDSRGAAVGAGTGLLFGSAAGAGAAETSAWQMQQRYDVTYTQCMYAKGHKVPVSGRFTSAPAREPAYAPPPPPGTQPPPRSSSAPPPSGSYAPPPAPGTYNLPPSGAYAPPPAPGTGVPPATAPIR